MLTKLLTYGALAASIISCAPRAYNTDSAVKEQESLDGAQTKISEPITETSIKKAEYNRCTGTCTRGYVTLYPDTPKAIPFYYTLEGTNDKKPIILIHGGGLTSNMHASLSKKLSENNFKVWKYDVRGHGLTRNPSKIFNYDLLTDDLNEFIKVNKIVKPIVYGYSDGGITAVSLAIKYPDAAKAVVTIGGSPIERDLTHYMAGMEIFYGQKPAGDLNAWLDSLLKSDSMISMYTERHLEGMELLKFGWRAWAEPVGYKAAELAKITVPLTVLIANKDQFFTVEDTQRFKSAIKNAKMIVVEDDHLFFKHQPELYEKTMLEVLSSF